MILQKPLDIVTETWYNVFMTTTQTTAEAVAEFTAQPVLQPGDEGWWKVWGASPQDIRRGDLVLTRGDEFLVEDLFDSVAAPMRVGVVVDGERQSIGALCPVVILRRGTKNTLAGSVR